MFVVIEQVKKVYGQGNTSVVALSDINFSFEINDFLAICGPSGSGKTTLLTTIAGLHHPTEGRVQIDDISIYEDLDVEGLAAFRNEYAGFVFQSFYLIPYLSALQNVMLPLTNQKLSTKQKEKMAINALERVGLANRILHLPSELSGGQCQRVAIARELVNDPKIIFADEPTGNLDTKTKKEILDIFHQITKNDQSVVMVTHDPNNLAKANKTINLIDGRINL